MRPLFAAALVVPLILAACTPPAPEAAPAPAEPAVSAEAAPEAPACSVEASGLPLPSLGDGYTASASASGEACSAATLRLTLRGPDGAVLHTDEANSSYLLGFADATSPDTMEVALEAWAGDALSGEPSTTANLPKWQDGASHPMAGEFHFYVEDGIDPAAYEAIRAAATPMYCYIQGMESLACLSIEGAAVRKIGAQTVPG